MALEASTLCRRRARPHGSVLCLVFLMTCKPPLYLGPEYIKYFNDKTIDVSVLCNLGPWGCCGERTGAGAWWDPTHCVLLVAGGAGAGQEGHLAGGVLCQLVQ